MAGGLRRGDLVIVSAPGDDAKPRPALVTRSDVLDTADSVLVAPFTSAVSAAPLYRLTVAASTTNGLNSTSQVTVDKILAYPRTKCGPVIGRLSGTDMLVLNNMSSVMVGLAD